MIISGLTDTGIKVQNSVIVKQIAELKKKLKNSTTGDIDYMRLLGVYMSCYGLLETDRNTMIKSIVKED